MSIRQASKIMDYTAFFNKTSRARKPSSLRALYDAFGTDTSYILMAGGLPNPEVFPVKEMTLTLRDGSVSKVSQQNLNDGLQYGITVGHPKVREFLENLVKRLHDPPCMRDPGQPDATKIILTAGSNDGIYKTFEILVEEGDTVLTEEYVYPNILCVAEPLGCNVTTVRSDKYGIVPESLEAELSKWPKPADGKPSNGKLKALYCVPNGDNPTGIRYTYERKREIYRLAHEYNFFIIEDDAYYFLEERPFTESFLSMDVDGRVIRLETFSKTVAPGLRLGYVCAPGPIFDQLTCVSQASTQGTSSLSQMVLLELVRKWGVDGYLKHCEEVSEFYAERRCLCEDIAKKHLTGLAEWNAPSGGMFLWIKIKGIKDTFSLVMERFVKRKVLIVAGAAFLPDAREATPYIRVSFSVASAEVMEKGFAIMAEEIRALQSEQNN